MQCASIAGIPVPSSGLLVLLAVTCLGGSATQASKDKGQTIAREAWSQLERITLTSESAGEPNWTHIRKNLEHVHPHAEASGVLAWLLLFGVPDAHGKLRAPGGFPRDVDAAIAIARAGARLESPSCGRCHALLGLLLSIGFPPLVNVVHVVPSKDEQSLPRLLFTTHGAVSALPFGSAESSQLPQDTGPMDPAATAYVLAAAAGDPFGILAVTHLSHHGLIDPVSLQAAEANRASAVTPRTPREVGLRLDQCDPGLTSALGELASTAIDASQQVSPWPPPQPLSARISNKPDKAWRDHVLSNPQSVSPDELVQVAHQLDAGGPEAAQVPMGSPSASLLRNLAAERGHTGAALRVAVEHLRHNATSEAQQLLEKARDATKDAAEAEMAQYYLRRYAASQPDAVAAWSHLERAADLGRAEADLLVAHAHAGGGGVDLQGVAGNRSEAMRRYRRIAGAASNGSLSGLESFAAYNLGVLLLQNETHTTSNTSPLSNQSLDSEKYGRNDSTSFNQLAGRTADESTSDATPTAELQAHRDAEKHGTMGSHSNFNRTSETTGVNQASHPDEDGGSPPCHIEAQQAFAKVVLSQLPSVRLSIALAQRSARLGDTVGALLLSSLLSDTGHPIGHEDSAYLWDSWARRRPAHLGSHQEEDLETLGLPDRNQPCNLTGWWTTSTEALTKQNVSVVYASMVEGGGFEMFNVSVPDSHRTLAGLNATDLVIPVPARTQFRHLHSFLWHSTHDVLPNGAPVPVALQPPAAVPHLVEYHHQRGKLMLDKTCSMARVEGMYVNWTFHRLDAPHPRYQDSADTCEGFANEEHCSKTSKPDVTALQLGTKDFLQCWIRPSWYFRALDLNMAARKPAKQPSDSWEAILALTSSEDCPCYGGFACRRADGACIAREGPATATCPAGSQQCLLVPHDAEPHAKPKFSARPEVCALAYHRRAAAAGSVDALHVLSHAYSNGIRGAEQDAATAFAFSEKAMRAGDARGRFDVAYSLEFGLGISPDPPRAYAMYRELLDTNSDVEVPIAAKVSTVLALMSASGRYLASRLLGNDKWRHAPWSATSQTDVGEPTS